MGFFKTKKKRKTARMVLAGKSKTGKTTLAMKLSSSPLFAPVGYIDMEKGITFYDDLLEDNGSDSIQANSLDEFDAVISELAKSKHKFPFKTIVVDSLTTLWARFVSVFDERVAGFAKAKNRGTLTETQMYSFEKQKTLNDWGKIKGLYHRKLRAILDLPCNVVFVGWEVDVIDADTFKATGEQKAKMEKNTDYFVDTTVRIYIDSKGKRRFNVDFDRSHAIKDGDPATVETLEKIMKVIEADGVTNDTKPVTPPRTVKAEEPKVDAPATIELKCEDCDAKISKAIALASKKQKGKTLCMSCMKKS